MPAYIVSIRHRTKDPEAIAEYARLAPLAGSVLGRRLKRMATSSGRFQALKGDAEGLSILEFATIDEAKAWFDSPEYQRALEHLFRGAEYEIFLVEGLPETFD